MTFDYIARLDPMPGETFVFSFDDDLGAEALEKIAAQFTERYPDNKLLILSQSVRFEGLLNTLLMGATIG